MAAAAPAERDATTRRFRFAELSSGLGAGVLGLGIGVLTATYLQGLGLPILIAGLILHGWGIPTSTGYDVLAIPVAAGVLYPAGILLTPAVSAVLRSRP